MCDLEDRMDMRKKDSGRMTESISEWTQDCESISVAIRISHIEIE